MTHGHSSCVIFFTQGKACGPKPPKLTDYCETHPPAAATTLLVALGGFKTTTHDALTAIFGVVFVATVGEMLRRDRLGKAE